MNKKLILGFLIVAALLAGALYEETKDQFLVHG
jgi:hypothetical protein